ncbi:MAG TPA: hypothetical protein VNS49_10360 [Streptomyces sp.]|nr:hypothetical protein [Streptomyces sp.]
MINAMLPVLFTRELRLSAGALGLLVGLVGRSPWLWLAGAGWLAVMTKTGIRNVFAVSLRQRLTPSRLLGRMNATFRFLLTGALAIGSVLGGLTGELISVRAAVWAGAACLALAFVPVFCSPMTRLHELPVPMESPGRRRTSAAP